MKVLAAAVRAHRAGRPFSMVTVVGVKGSAPRSGGARMLVFPDGSIEGTVGGGAWEHRLRAEGIAALETGRPTRVAVHLTRDLGMCCGGAMEALVEPFAVQEHLVIYGAGHVGRATAELALALDFQVSVIDERPSYAQPDRFPDGVSVVEAEPRRALAALPQGAHMFHLVVTHSHQLDQDLLEHLVERRFGWAGVIGSRAKLAKFFVRLRAAGVPAEKLAAISGPVGLDIGAETPAEIAVSILAELVRLRRGVRRPPTPLSDLPLEARGGDGRAHPPAFGDAASAGVAKAD